MAITQAQAVGALGAIGAVGQIGSAVASFIGARNAKKAGKKQAKAILKETERQQFFRTLEATKNQGELATAFAKSGVTGNVVSAVEAEFAMWERGAVDQIGYEGRVAAWQAKQRGKGQASALQQQGISAIQQGVVGLGESYFKLKSLED